MANLPDVPEHVPSLSTSSGSPLVKNWADEEYEDAENLSMPESWHGDFPGKTVALNDIPAVHVFDPSAEVGVGQDSDTEEGDQPYHDDARSQHEATEVDGGSAEAEAHLSKLVLGYACRFKEHRREEDLQHQLHAKQRDAKRQCHMGKELFDTYVKDRAARNLKKKKRKEAKQTEGAHGDAQETVIPLHVQVPGPNHHKNVVQRKARKMCLQRSTGPHD